MWQVIILFSSAGFDVLSYDNEMDARGYYVERSRCPDVIAAALYFNGTPQRTYRIFEDGREAPPHPKGEPE